MPARKNTKTNSVNPIYKYIVCRYLYSCLALLAQLSPSMCLCGSPYGSHPTFGSCFSRPFPLSLPPLGPAKSAGQHRRKMEEPLLRALSYLKFRGSLHSSKYTQLLALSPDCCWSIHTWNEPFPNQTQQAQHGHLQSAELASRASATSTVTYLKGAISTWAQQAQHDQLHSPHSEQLSCKYCILVLSTALGTACSASI